MNTKSAIRAYTVLSIAAASMAIFYLYLIVDMDRPNHTPLVFLLWMGAVIIYFVAALGWLRRIDELSRAGADAAALAAFGAFVVTIAGFALQSSSAIAVILPCVAYFSAAFVLLSPRRGVPVGAAALTVLAPAVLTISLVALFADGDGKKLVALSPIVGFCAAAILRKNEKRQVAAS